MRRLWPALLLLGLVVIEVLGACGSVRVVRQARRTKPLEVRYNIRRDHLFWVFTLSRDTTGVELRYRGQPIMPFDSCELSAQPGSGQWRRPFIENAWRQSGAAPRWLLNTFCSQERVAYLLRLSATGPEFIRIGAVNELPVHRRLVLQPLNGGPVSYMPETHTSGWLFNERTLRSEPVRLPEPAELYGLPWTAHVAYTVSPDLRVLARVYRPNVVPVKTGAGGFPSLVQTAPQPRLVIDQYDLDRRTMRRLKLEGVNQQVNELLQFTQWVQTDGRWELLGRP
ncbi:hypothetical protein B0919_18250 [Hymenobacter sp. CRA2]|nr:hypothetical protein B0919_18250 [Hymenobacter sp. CRA2]